MEKELNGLKTIIMMLIKLKLNRLLIMGLMKTIIVTYLTKLQLVEISIIKKALFKVKIILTNQNEI